MPIQILELVFKAVIEDEKLNQNKLQETLMDRDDIIAECVEQTLKQLEMLKER